MDTIINVINHELTDNINGITGTEHSTMNEVNFISESNNGFTNEIENNKIPSLTTQESLLNDSRFTPTGNGDPTSKPYCTQPTSGQKWWAAVLLGFIFALISSPVAYNITSSVTSAMAGITLMEGPGPNFIGLVIHTIIFIIIIRLILW